MYNSDECGNCEYLESEINKVCEELDSLALTSGQDNELLAQIRLILNCEESTDASKVNQIKEAFNS